MNLLIGLKKTYNYERTINIRGSLGRRIKTSIKTYTMKEDFNPFRVDEEVRSEKAIAFAFKSLKNEWMYDDDFIMKVATHFECASEGNIFLDILDGADGNIEEAWEVYCDERGISHEMDYNPFKN